MTASAIDGVSYDFMSIEGFRVAFGLPDAFAIAAFEPKDGAGLGSLDGSRDALARVRQRVLAAVPATATVHTLMDQVAALARLFRQELEIANRQVRLRPVEIDFAVAGFEDVIQNSVYKLVQLRFTCRDNLVEMDKAFDFGAVYQEWLNASARISATVHPYHHADHRFDCWVIYYPYGRMGLKVAVDGQLFYLMDGSLACPAASYMKGLCAQVAGRLCQALILGERE